MNKKKNMFRRISALLLALSFVLTGCGGKSDQDKFAEITDEIFYDSVTADGLSLHMTLSDPESYGITEFPATLGTYSLEDMKENFEDMMDTRKQLLKIKKDKLTEQQQIDYEILLATLDVEENADEFYLYGYPLSSVNGMQAQLPIIFAEYVFNEKQDVDNYLLLLADTDEYYEQILTFIQEQTKEGIYLSDVTIDGIIESCQLYLNHPEDGILADTFATRLDGLSDVTAEERASYIEQNRKILEEDFTEAYKLLTEGLTELKGNLDEPIGLCKLPKGREYYEYLLKSSIYTSYKRPKDLQNAMLDRLQNDMMSIYEIMDERPEVYYEFMDSRFSITDPQEALLDLREKLEEDFPEAAGYNYEVREIPEALREFSSSAFYLTPPIDNQDQNSIYVNPDPSEGVDRLYTVMAHEGFPGHMYQHNYFNAVNDSKLRAVLNYSSYTEGWATYVELLSYMWDDNMDNDVAKMRAADTASSLALYGLVDYQVNYEGMSVEELGEFLESMFGISDEEATRSLYQFVCEIPTNYLEYFVGYMEFMDMRDIAENTLGDKFDSKEFHKFLLDFGAAPFGVIRSHFSDWLSEQKTK